MLTEEELIASIRHDARQGPRPRPEAHFLELPEAVIDSIVADARQPPAPPTAAAPAFDEDELAGWLAAQATQNAAEAAARQRRGS